MTVPNISCPSCGFTMQPVWYREKELDAHGIPTGRIIMLPAKQTRSIIRLAGM